MFIDVAIVYLFVGLIVGYIARSAQLAVAKWRYEREALRQFAATKAAAIAAKDFEARKLHPEQASKKIAE